MNALLAHLRALRLERGLTMRAMGARAGLSHSSFSHWGAGSHEPQLADLSAYANALGLRLALINEWGKVVAVVEDE